MQRRAFLVALFASAAFAQERVDLSVVHQIRTEAFQNSKVMDHAYQLTDVYGPRLSGSPQLKKAADWVAQTLKDMGLANVHLEKWGPFGKGWTYTYYAGHLLEPSYQPIIGIPRAWTPGTNGPVTGEAVLAPINTEADFEKYRGKLRGKMILITDPRDLALPANSLVTRFSDQQLADLNQFPVPVPQGRRGGRGGGQAPLNPEQLKQFRTKLNQFLRDEGAVVQLMGSNPPGDAGLVFGGGADREISGYLPTIMLAPEQYNRIVRLLEHNITPKLQFEVKAEFIEDQPDLYNVVAEIPGNGKKDEVVMLGAHLDSWHYGTGATDNAAGTSVAMEAMRILKTLNLKMDRTVRIALWTGEEEGLLGSEAYVKEHFADRKTMKTTVEHDRFAGYFNLDNGTGKVRGVYLQGNDAMRPIVEKWFEPFHDLGAQTVILRNTGGTDHLSFDRIGLPGFQFIQDPLDYNTRTHHSNIDTYDRLQPADLEQASAIMASFVYNAATRPDKLPRKPLPKPEPPPKQNP